MNPPTSPDSTLRVLRWWLRTLSVAIALAALAYSAADVRRGVLLALTVLLGFLPFTYARRRLHQAVAPHLRRPNGGPGLLVAWTALGIACDLLMVSQLLLARSPDPNPLLNASPLAWIGPVWFSGHALVLLGFGGLGLGRLAGRTFSQLRTRPVADNTAPALSRRGFLRQASLVGVSVPFGVSLSGVGTSYDFQVEHRDAHLEQWPARLDGLRVAHLSDIHVGGAMNREKLLRVAELTNGTKPDLVLHTGDFLTHRSGNFDEPLYEALAQIEAPYGQWACLGNHDYDNAPRFVRRLADCGVTALRNEAVMIDVRGQPLEIAGLEYLSARIDRTVDYKRILAEFGPRTAPRLLLNHDPQGFSALPDSCADLVLSGHTHGGHIGVQLGADSALSVVGMVGLRDQGFYDRGDMRLYVTRCVGFYGYPMRIGIPPEIALLTLRRKT
ncbi:MAG: metallophosphoesterase [Candidatus Binatia bacterium]|nr:metallophosphoesterase [Candidatus Binatia bacterium]